MKRILTKEGRQQYIDSYRQVSPYLDRYFKSLNTTGDAHFEKVGDLAAISSNQFHNPQTGFKEFYSDTPDWVIEIAQRRGWL